MGRALQAILFVSSALVSATAPMLAAACPRCAAGESARAAFLADPELATHLTALLAPFALPLLVVLALGRLGLPHPAPPATQGETPCHPARIPRAR